MIEEKETTSSNQAGEVVDDKPDTGAESESREKNTDQAEKSSKSSPVKGRKAEKKYEQKIEELESKLNELNDNYLRLFSEFDNYRKRTNKERLELLKTASEDTIISLLPVLDDFERAIMAMEKNGSTGIDVDGIGEVAVDVRLQLAQALAQLLCHLVQRIFVQFDASALHSHDDRHQRHFDLFEKPPGIDFVHFGFLERYQA